MKIVKYFETCQSSAIVQTWAFYLLTKALARNDIELYRSNTGVHARQSQRFPLACNRSAYLLLQNWQPVRCEPAVIAACNLSLVVVAETDDIEAIAAVWCRGDEPSPWQCSVEDRDAWGTSYRGPFIQVPSACGQRLDPDAVIDDWAAFCRDDAAPVMLSA